MKIFKDEEYSKKATINLLILIMIISGIFGFIYETFFYRIDLGYFVKRGSTFGPWIPIYAFGGIFITITTYNLKDKPLLVLTINCIVTGLLEYLTGFVLFKFFDTRLWDYNNEIWNFGNINGYICFRSIAFFGLSGLLLIYVIIPILKKIINKFPENKVSFFSGALACVFSFDMILYWLLK